MFLTALKLRNFKNYPEVNLEFSEKVNIIYGDNGSGKTNLLDAIHFLSVSKSYFGMSDKYLVREGEGFYRLEGYYKKDDKPSQLVLKYKLDQKRVIQLNQRTLKKVSDLLGKFPTVFVAPDDIKIVKGGSKDRRDYFNKWMCQADTEYLESLMNYNRLLRRKDAMLKSDHTPSKLVIEAINHQMIPLAKTIHQKIKANVTPFAENVRDHYKEISNGNERVDLTYESEIDGDRIEEMFDQMIYQEIRSKRPLIGIQRDDYTFSINDKPLKKYGSQGQIKSFLYALRLSEFFFLNHKLNVHPILMLDDYFEKLDRSRLASLLALINSNQFGQVFLSDTELDRSRNIFTERGINFSAYHVVNGVIDKIH